MQRVTPMTVEGEDNSFPFHVLEGDMLRYGSSSRRLADVKSRHYLAWLWCKVAREPGNPDQVAALRLIANHGQHLDEKKSELAWGQILKEQQDKDRQAGWTIPALEVVSWSNHKQGGTMPENLTGDALLAFVYVDAWLGGAPGEEPPRLDDPMIVAEARQRDENAALSLVVQFE